MKEIIYKSRSKQVKIQAKVTANMKEKITG